VWNEDHTGRNFSLLALEEPLTGLGAHAEGVARRDSLCLHVVGVHYQGINQGQILGVVFADVDLLALLGCAASVHDETPAAHRSPPVRVGPVSGAIRWIFVFCECTESEASRVTGGVRIESAMNVSFYLVPARGDNHQQAGKSFGCEVEARPSRDQRKPISHSIRRSRITD